jgi:hypothetical protein
LELPATNGHQPMPQLGDCTHHARVRMQQRGISDDALDLLMRYGRTAHDHHGHVLLHMDRRARRAALRACGRAAGPMVDRVLGLYAVLGTDGVVITVGHRYRRIRRN